MKLPSISALLLGKRLEPRRHFDVAMITDVRFPGGSGSSTAQEIRIQHEAGLRTALFHAPSIKIGRRPKRKHFKAKHRQPSPKLRKCLDASYADFMHTGAKVYAPLTIIRHPTVANWERFLPKHLETDEIVVVINHPAVRTDGLIDYELATVIQNIKSVFRRMPRLCPISPVIAEACRGKGSQEIALDDFWYNIFDLPANLARPRSAGEPIVIGRHSRDSRDKWPDDPAIIRQAYPMADGIGIKVLGGAETARAVLGDIPANWQVLSFDPFGVESFLKSIDVYVYFHHAAWVEAFGRAPCEAIIAGIPTILPRSFEPTFGNAAIYCEPSDVLSVVRRLQEDPDWYADVSRRGRDLVSKRFGPAHHIERLLRIGKIAPRPGGI